MKLLFDQNLPPHLVDALSNEFPDSSHVHLLGLGEARDSRIWEVALNGGFVIVSKDSDFAALSMLRGHPPKVIWVALGNCTSDEIRELMHSNAEDIREFGEIDEESYLVLR